MYNLLPFNLYTIDNPDFIVFSLMENSIDMKRVRVNAIVPKAGASSNLVTKLLNVLNATKSGPTLNSGWIAL